MSQPRDFFSVEGVKLCSFPHLKSIFETLLLQKKCRQQDLADYLGVSRAYVSMMVHGKMVPPLDVRLKVASFFGVDSVLIWRMPKEASI